MTEVIVLSTIILLLVLVLICIVGLSHRTLMNALKEIFLKMDKPSSKPTSHDIKQDVNTPIKEMPEDIVEDVKKSDEAKDKDEIDKLLDEHMQQLKHALNNTYKDIMEGSVNNEQSKR